MPAGSRPIPESRAALHVILIPEVPIDLADVCAIIKRRDDAGKRFSIVVVAEGAKLRDEGDASKQLDEFGHEQLKGIGETIGAEIEKRTGHETRVTVLGHIQRGGTPTAHDRVLATRFGVFACDLVARGDFGKMAALRGYEVEAVPLADAVKELKIGRSQAVRSGLVVVRLNRGAPANRAAGATKWSGSRVAVGGRAFPPGGGSRRGVDARVWVASELRPVPTPPADGADPSAS